MISHSNQEEKTELEKRPNGRFSVILKTLAILWFSYVVFIYFLGGSIWLANLLSFIPPISILIVSFVLLAIYICNLISKFRFENKYKYVFLVLSLIIFSFSINLADVNLGGKRSDNENAIKVFNWNTQFLEKESNKEKFVEFLKEQNADIYLLQEFIPNPKVNGLDSQGVTEYVSYIQQEFEGYEVLHVGELVFISKFKLFDYTKEGVEQYLRADFWVNDEIVSFYNVHIPVHIDMNYYGDIPGLVNNVKRRFDWRNDVLKTLEEDIKDNSKSFIITGDFNTTKAMRKMSSLEKLTKDSIRSSGKIFNNTWSAKWGKFWRIDYVLGNDDINFNSHNIIDPGELSDHYGLLVELTIDK